MYNYYVFKKKKIFLQVAKELESGVTVEKYH